MAPSDAPPGINLIGYLDSLVGIGESARRAMGALRLAGVPVAPRALRLPAPVIDGGRTPALTDVPLPHDVTVVWCSPDRYGVDVDLGRLRRDSGRLVGRWAWELPELPPAWAAHAARLDEIWVPSTFVADAVRACTDVPLRVVPNPVAPSPSPVPLDRARFSVPAGDRLVAFVMDHHSTLPRKNPLGAIEAHRRAFAPDDGVTLLIKTLNARQRRLDHRALLEAAAGRPDVRIVDAALTAAERDGLIAGCDAYLSLHRSEGFGNTIAEAMALGRPVVATAFGGHLDVLDGANGYPVAWTPAMVGPDAAPYPADGQWAEPDPDDAAAQLRRVLGDPAEAAEHGRRAARDIAATHGPAAAGRTLADAVRGVYA